MDRNDYYNYSINPYLNKQHDKLLKKGRKKRKTSRIAQLIRDILEHKVSRKELIDRLKQIQKEL